jgi:hypothetical protein
MSTFSITIEIPEGTEDPQRLAGSLAIATGDVLLRESAAGEQAEGTTSAKSLTDDPVAVVKPDAPGTQPSGERVMYTGEKGEGNLRSLLQEVAANTRKTLRTIAEASQNSGSIHAIELRKKLNASSASVIAGYLTSLGFAKKRTGLPKPYTQRWAQRNGVWGNVYAMEPDVASAVMRLVGEDGEMASA